MQPNRLTLTAAVQKIIPKSSEKFLLLKCTPIYHVQKTNSELVCRSGKVFYEKALNNLNQNTEKYISRSFPQWATGTASQDS